MIKYLKDLECINLERLLLLRGKELSLTDEECHILLLIDTFVTLHKKMITPSLLLKYSSLTPHEMDHILDSLLKKKWIFNKNGAICLNHFEEKLLENKEAPVEEKMNMVDIFEEQFGRPLTPMEFDSIKEWVQSGYSEEIILKALKEAVKSQVLTLRYIEGILINWAQNGIKERYIEEYILDHRDRSGIVYCATRKSVESVCKELRSVGISATRYHAGLTPEERSKNQEDFVYDRKRVMVATNAFGMGIDKSNVSFVLHYNMPKNLENYYQEAGRAGRDGERAECILLFSLGDVQTAKYFIQNSHDNDELTPEQVEAAARRDRERLDVMVGYCKTTRCLRSYLLDYFGEHHTGGCGNCSNCTGEFVQTDITTEAQKILSGVARIQKRWPGGLGVVALVQMLRGAKDQKTLERGLDQFPTYGIMRDVPPQRMRLYLDALQEQGYLAETGDEFPVITLTAKAPAVLFHGEQVTMQERAATAQETQAKRRASRKKTAARTALSEADDSLLASLKTLRSELAQKNHVPAYIVFNNVSLDEMAEIKPRTMGDFRRISGVGDAKAAKYGEAFIKHIAKWVREHSEEE